MKCKRFSVEQFGIRIDASQIMHGFARHDE